MPQMSPISWINMFIIFSISFLIFNMMNYYLYSPNLPKSNLILKSKISNQLNWKW
uniref:ATP synthase complex subunit 8 n=1 Tax=Morinia doronici TaxID=1606798 RepID=A0A7G7CCZ0_9MUSC|nr:ATP synthase F0 subunit 8 [Morinia doronici]